MSKTVLIIRGAFDGEHCWPEAPDAYEYLRHVHHHSFGFEAAIEVTEDRQVEFLALRDHVSRAMGEYLQYYVALSCESLAEKMFEWLSHCTFQLPDGKHGPFKVLWTEVNEDGGCGARICLGREAS